MHNGFPGMIAAIVPQFFSTDLERTLLFYRTKLGFETQFEYGDPVFYAGAIRDGHSFFFRHVDHAPPRADEKYEQEWLDAYIRVIDTRALYAEFTDRNANIFRDLAEMPWGFTEFVVKDCDGRLLCFGQLTDPDD